MITPNRNSPLNRGRVAWWLAKSGLASGFEWVDLIHQIPISYTSAANPPIPAIGRPGMLQARYTTGTTPTLAALDIGPSDCTLAMWVKVFNLASELDVLRAAGPGAPFPGYILAIGGGVTHKLNYWNGNGVQFSNSTSSVDTGAWTHCLVASSGTGGSGQSNFYINGVLDNQVTGTTAGQCTQWSGPRSFNGVSGSDGVPLGLLDVSIWNRQLSASEVWSLYTDSLTGYQQTLTRRRRLRSRGVAASGGGPVVGCGFIRGAGASDGGSPIIGCGFIRGTGSAA